jgi:predicted RNase H-like HicB family nuclease
VAWFEGVPGALTQGRTLAEAGANLKDAIRLMLVPVDVRMICRQLGVPAPQVWQASPAALFEGLLSPLMS